MFGHLGSTSGTKPFTKFTKFTENLILGNDLSPGCHSAYNFTSAVQKINQDSAMENLLTNYDSHYEQN